MKIATAAVLTGALIAGSAQAATILDSDALNVAGLSAGQSFQLVFVTSTKIQGDLIDGVDDSKDTSTISQWNAHVTSVAGSSSFTGIAGLNWSAIVSVDNLSDASAGIAASVNAPALNDVYRTDGTLVAASADFYTSTHLAPIKWNENGDEQDTNGGSGAGRLVWTGSTGAGAIDSRPLGNSPLSDTGGSRTGNAESINDDWINTSDATRRGPDTALRVYALSEVITIVPEPGSLALLGLGGLLIGFRRRRG